ncbi:MAG: 2-hydroxyacid dehydrogenase [Cytophagaceae bacterium]|nr:2-hydroxyacid dehydrogenase [Cytophagaceae bacterium]
MKVVVYSTKQYERAYLEKSNRGKHDFLFLEEVLSVKTVELAKECSAVSIFTNDDASSEVLKQLANLNIKSITTRAAGYDNIDLNEAEKLNLKITNVPEYSPYAIAEHTVAMILAMNRKIVQADRQVKNYNFALDDLIGFDLHGKTVGIIGLGKIGSIVAKILNGFGCKLLGYDIEQNEALTKAYGMEYVSLGKLCKIADIITLHAPLNTNTHYIINKENLQLMKKGVMIVNTGRGGLVNTADALDALKEGKIGYLGLDVYEKEKGLFFYDHSRDIPQDDLFACLLPYKNVLITGHQAFLTENALGNIADTTIYNLDCFQKSEQSLHELTGKKPAVRV